MSGIYLFSCFLLVFFTFFYKFHEKYHKKKNHIVAILLIKFFLTNFLSSIKEKYKRIL